jgi:hypothetical protein
MLEWTNKGYRYTHKQGCMHGEIYPGDGKARGLFWSWCDGTRDLDDNTHCSVEYETVAEAKADIEKLALEMVEDV